MPNYSTISDFRPPTSDFLLLTSVLMSCRGSSIVRLLSPLSAASPHRILFQVFRVAQDDRQTKCGSGLFASIGAMSAAKYVSATAGRVNKKSEVSSEW